MTSSPGSNSDAWSRPAMVRVGEKAALKQRIVTSSVNEDGSA